MSNITFLDIAPQLMMKVPDAPVPYIVRCLREAAIEFCEKSHSYVHRFDPITVIPNIATYDVDIPLSTAIVKVHRVGFRGAELRATSAVLLDQQGTDWETKPGTPTHYFFRQKVLNLVPVPNVLGVQTINGWVSLKPSRGATFIDVDFFDENEQAICDGALMKMFSDKDQLWGNMQLSNLHGAQFYESVEDAKSKSQQDHTAKRDAVQYGGI